MKIGILTHPLGTNYGGMLQNFALQTALKECGHEPVTLYYESLTPLKIKVMSMAGRLVKKMMGRRVPLRGWPTEREARVIAQYTEQFIDKYIATTRKCELHELASLKSENFDALVVGSDQVWRGVDGNVDAFFLSDFVDVKVPKLAYAASLGVDWWPFGAAQTARCKELVKQFGAVSVREDNAVALCRENLGVDAKWTLDPTMLIDKRYYEDAVKAYETKACPKNMMMVYVLDKSATKKDIVAKVGEELGLTPHSVMSGAHFYDVGPRHLDDCIFPPVEEWLKGFIEAEYVVTDSFHGTVFSIIFNKPFVSIANNERGRGRFNSLLGMFGLEDRLVDSWEQTEKVLRAPIDYKKVNEILEARRGESLAFLKDNLK